MRPITVRIACAQLAARPATAAREALADICAAVRSAAKLDAQLLVLPECSYPGYVLLTRNPYRHDVPSARDALISIARQARKSRLAIVVGIARPHLEGLRNEAVLLDAAGQEIGAYAKTRLWNFDRRWFVRGRSLPVFDTSFGRIGLMICADGRNPEIARTLAAQGAWLIADPTAWVGYGWSHADIRNVQADYMLAVRALENGVWIAAADKCGSELEAVHYAGRTQIVGPDGNRVAGAESSLPQIVCADVPKTCARPFVVSLSVQQRAVLGSPVARARSQTRKMPRFWVGVYQSSVTKSDDALAMKALRAQGIHALIRTGQRPKTVARALLQARGLRSAVVLDDQMLAPEPARAAALQGADLIVWLTRAEHSMTLEIAKTRAVENRIYVVVATPAPSRQASCVIAPDGSLGARALAKQRNGFVTVIDTALARRKEIVPGTQTFADRLPHRYRWLDAQAGTIAP